METNKDKTHYFVKLNQILVYDSWLSEGKFHEGGRGLGHISIFLKPDFRSFNAQTGQEGNIHGSVPFFSSEINNLEPFPQHVFINFPSIYNACSV